MFSKKRDVSSKTEGTHHDGIRRAELLLEHLRSELSESEMRALNGGLSNAGLSPISGTTA